MVLPFLSIYLTDELDFSFYQAGFILSVFGVGSLFGSFLGGHLADRIGYYSVIFYSLFLGGLSLFGFLWVHDYYGLCALVFLASMVGEAFRPAMMASIAIYSKEENRTRSIALIRLAINLGYALGPALGGILAYNVGYNYLFIIDGATCILAAFVMRMTLRERTNQAQKDDSENIVEDEGSPLQNAKFLYFLIGMMLTGLIFMQLFYAAPVYYKNDLGLNENTIGMLLALNAMFIVIFEMPIIHSLEGRFNQVQMLTFGSLLIGISYLVMSAFPSIILVVAYVILISLGEMFNFPYSNQLVMEISDSKRGQYLAYYTMAFSVAHIFAPSFGLILAEEIGFQMLWLISGLICVVACYVLFKTGKKLLAQKSVMET